ncbi:hypothetical protein [Bacillus sp. FJAT-44742]|uniref:hypothetical protein n=1 Tax=Bacillus sp. FJAT-44742 TaxID=2014005 RepID=UPI000C23180F|nr:hypothetical protein [Bacillus sp. FJAT-44742]
MTKDEIMNELEKKEYTEILDLLEEAENGKLAEIEIVKSLGLLRDETLNDQVLQLFSELGVEIVYADEE